MRYVSTVFRSIALSMQACALPLLCACGNLLSSGEQMHTVSDSRKQPGPPSCALRIVPLKMSLSLVLCIHLNLSLLSGEGVASL